MCACGVCLMDCLPRVQVCMMWCLVSSEQILRNMLPFQSVCMRRHYPLPNGSPSFDTTPPTPAAMPSSCSRTSLDDDTRSTVHPADRGSIACPQTGWPAPPAWCCPIHCGVCVCVQCNCSNIHVMFRVSSRRAQFVPQHFIVYLREYLRVLRVFEIVGSIHVGCLLVLFAITSCVCVALCVCMYGLTVMPVRKNMCMNVGETHIGVRSIYDPLRLCLCHLSSHGMLLCVHTRISREAYAIFIVDAVLWAHFCWYK